jgi:hypothetical protein
MITLWLKQEEYDVLSHYPVTEIAGQTVTLSAMLDACQIAPIVSADLANRQAMEAWIEPMSAKVPVSHPAYDALAAVVINAAPFVNTPILSFLRERSGIRVVPQNPDC